MFHSTFQVKTDGSQDYARLVTYIQDMPEEIGIKKRPLILFCPGGGYEYTSARESEPLAMQFAAMGYHTAILYYSCAPSRFPVQITELAGAVALIRKNAGEWGVDPNGIIIQGCSAGGHLAASYGCMWNEDFVIDAVGCENDRELLRPNGMILCYPVITSGEYAHRGSFMALLGEEHGNPGDKLCDSMSLENLVNKNTPPTFIWHTFEDGSVPVENSLYFATALRENGISTELHIFEKGGHGLSTADELTAGREGKEFQEHAASWIELVRGWLKERFPLTVCYKG